MQDANKKVNQYALESAAAMIPILKDSLHHVLVPMVTVVTDNLNSKYTGIYTAAVTVLDALMKNIGKAIAEGDRCSSFHLHVAFYCFFLFLQKLLLFSNWLLQRF